MANSCATEIAGCASTGTSSGAQDDPCWVGGPALEDGELLCFVQEVCSIDAARGFIIGQDEAAAAGACATTACGTISSASNDAIACLTNSCFNECMPITGSGC